MKKKVGMSAGFIAAALFPVLVSVGCAAAGGAEGISQNALAVQKDGQVILYIVDSFDKEYYDIEELRRMAEEETEVYNLKTRAGGEQGVTLEEVSRVGTGKELVRVVYRFADGEAYLRFQGENLYYGTLEEAVSLGHVLPDTVFSCADGYAALDEKNAARWRGRHVIVTDAKTHVYPPAEIYGCSGGVRLCEDGSADTSGCETAAVLLLGK